MRVIWLIFFLFMPEWHERPTVLKTDGKTHTRYL